MFVGAQGVPPLGDLAVLVVGLALAVRRSQRARTTCSTATSTR
jgi:hypothetical protein